MEGSIGLETRKKMVIDGPKAPLTIEQRVRMFKPREVVNFEGSEWMISGINTETGEFDLTREGETLKDVDPFRIGKIDTRAQEQEEQEDVAKAA